MLVYPQLATGVLTQFPVQKRRRLLTVVNTAADGSVVKLAEPSAGIIEWQMNYTGLSDADLATLQQFFAAAEGSLNGFTFLDPVGNLLAWSSDLSNAVWSYDPFLVKTGAVTDPDGGTQAWQLSNTGAAAQQVSQTLAVPGGYLFSFSAYVQSPGGATVTALIGTSRAARAAASGWSRIVYTASGDPTATSVVSALELPPGAVINVYGLQVEPQPAPSLYKPSSNGGVYQNARLRDDTLNFTSLAPNCHSATVNVLYASHL
jgi:hypothetical protein